MNVSVRKQHELKVTNKNLFLCVFYRYVLMQLQKFGSPKHTLSLLETIPYIKLWNTCNELT